MGEPIVESTRDTPLAEIRPDTLAKISGGWQQRKSAEMRIVILEATVECLVAHGYAGLSTQQVTKRAGVSRGAMHHHFASKMHLVSAVTEYIFFKRIERFLADFEAATLVDDGDVTERATEMYWQSVQTREYAAYLELAIAARSDEELNRTFLPAAQRYDRVWSEEMVKAFPQWEGRWHKLRLASDFAAAAHMGVLLAQPVLGRRRVGALLDLVVEVVKRLHAEFE